MNVQEQLEQIRQTLISHALGVVHCDPVREIAQMAIPYTMYGFVVHYENELGRLSTISITGKDMTS